MRASEMRQEAPPPAMSSRAPPHVLLVSLPVQGHVTPLLVLGRRLASRGLLVTLTTVPVEGYIKNLAQELGRDDGLRFEPLTGAGLRAPDDPRYNVVDNLAYHLDAAAPAALAGLIRRQADVGRPVTCVVANAFNPWALRAARETGVPGAMLWTQSCAALSLHYHYFNSLAAFPATEAGPSAPVHVPGLPPLVSGDLPTQIHAPEEFIWRQAIAEDMRSLRTSPVSWVLANTFDELERATIDALRVHLPVLPVGPLSETDNDDGCHDDDECTAWLDAQPARSVVFVAFGSLVKPSREEMAELAAGLVCTGRPFLWVVRDDSRDLLPVNVVMTEIKNNGKVVPWCRQRCVLAHAATGCFVTHCGWNSTVETLAAGVPVVAYPAWSDQPTNAKLLVDVFGVGVRLPSPLARDALRRCVEEVMVGSAAEAMRSRACEWKTKASKAVVAGGSADRGVQDFVDALRSMSE